MGGGEGLMTWPLTTWSGTYPVGGHWAGRVLTAGNDDDVLTVDELKERTHVVESDALLKSYISAARQQVERDTGLTLPTTQLAIEFGTAPAAGEVLLIPYPPLQEITVMTGFDAAGNPVAIDIEDPTQVLLINVTSKPARVTFGSAFNPGSTTGLWLTITAGWTKDTLPPLLKQAVALLASHYVTFGRDLATLDSVVPMPMGYEAAIQPFRLEVVV
jgi:uncharacterized phiE125 gp8 family phage protein